MNLPSELPVVRILPAYREALEKHNKIILSAAPGAGKTTVIPPETAALLQGGVRLIEPRRVAARAAACRIAELDASSPGEFSGYAVRGESCRSARTRILAVTPGILVREFQEDPSLEGIDAVIFDEFHERSAECDLLLALALDVQASLRPDLKIIIMSATLASEALKVFLPDAAFIAAEGREFPVEIRYADMPFTPDFRTITGNCVRAVSDLFKKTQTGDVLVFLPGTGEIDAVARLLTETLPPEADIRGLHGALELKEQNRVLQKTAPGRRRVFLATNLAESSITIDGVTCVVDAGWEKRMSFLPGSGMSFLELERVSRASAIQRAGRAGRTAPGTAVRLYSKIEFGNLTAQRPPEITVCDLAFLVLQLADWGSREDQLRWLDPPPASGMAAARALLRKLGALDEKGLLTSHGRALNRLPLHPRLGNMLLRARTTGCFSTAAALAALLENRVFPRETADIRPRLREFQKNPGRFGMQQTVFRQLHSLMSVPAGAIEPEKAGGLLAFAYPEWIAKRQGGQSCSYRLAGGHAGVLDQEDPLRTEPFLAVASLSASASENARIRLAAPLDKQLLEEEFGAFFFKNVSLDFDPGTGKVSAVEELRFDAIVLSSRSVAPPPGTLGKAVLEAAVRRKNILPPENFKKANQLIDRVRYALKADPGIALPDWRMENWPRVLEEITRGWLDNVRSIPDLLKLNWDALVAYALSQEQTALLNKLYPEFFVTKRGYKIRIDYGGETPSAAVRIQELYGVTVHPCIGRKQLPLRLELLSPARRPVQITMDLPGFWKGSWTLVRKDMRGRYPKHDWPEHPEAEN